VTDRPNDHSSGRLRRIDRPTPYGADRRNRVDIAPTKYSTRGGGRLLYLANGDLAATGGGDTAV